MKASKGFLVLALLCGITKFVLYALWIWDPEPQHTPDNSFQCTLSILSAIFLSSGLIVNELEHINKKL